MFAPINFLHCDLVTHISQKRGLVSSQLKRYCKLNFEAIALLDPCLSHERVGLEAGVPGRGKDWFRHNSNNPEHPKLSCDDPDECAGDNGFKDKTKTAKQI